VSTLEPSPLHEAEFFMTELAKRQMQLGALVFNKVLPDFLLDSAARALSSRLIDASQAPGASTEQWAEQRVVRAVAENQARYALLAEEEANQRRRLGAQPAVLCSLAYRSDDLNDLAGLRLLGEELWP
jgi:hypothetical protein